MEGGKSMNGSWKRGRGGREGVRDSRFLPFNGIRSRLVEETD